MSRLLTTPLSVWGRTWWAGLRVLPRAPEIGLKRLILPVSYWRTQEFAYVGRQLTLGAGARVLDLGSPKDLASLLAHHRGYEVVAADILPKAVSDSSRYARALSVEGDGPGLVRSEVQDGRCLPYAAASFDAAFAVSVLEHIPDEGDHAAILELARVVRPGGPIIITTPYAPQFGETFVNRDVYERSRQGAESVFYERHYDDAALLRRLLDVPGTRVIDLQLWGEDGLPVEKMLTRRRLVRTALSPVEPLLASVALRQLVAGQGRPMAAFFTLERMGE